MSASDKKKLRKEQVAAQMSEKQRQQQSEDKKLKIYTVTFVTALILIVCLAVGIMIGKSVATSGNAQRKTIAATVGNYEINTVEMAYYYSDAINNMYSSIYTEDNVYADYYMEAMGLDTSKPLTEQNNPETGKTWAEYFLDSALETAQSDYAIYELAMKDPDFSFSEEDKQTLTTTISNLKAYAAMYGYPSTDKYLQAIYGYGADLQSYEKYLERAEIANAYYNFYYDGLSYDDEAIRAHEEEAGAALYNAYTYTYSYLSYNDFLTGGTKDADGNVTYTDEEKDAARAKAKEAAEKLKAAKTTEEMKELAETIEVAENSQLAVNEYTNEMHTSINTVVADWLADAKRKAGDKVVLENTAKVSEDSEETVVNGYYVIVYKSKTDNAEPMDNVRHLLIAFEGGTTDEATGETVYTDEEKQKAIDEAKALLEEYQKNATLDTFKALVKEHTDDTASAETGGLYENIHYNSEYVENFRNWAIDPNRKEGDVELVETEYGCHIMYYEGTSKLSYRDYMISEELRSAEVQTWLENAKATLAIAKKDTSKLAMDVTLG